MTETYIPFGDIQIPIDRTLHLLLGHSNSNWKNSSVPNDFKHDRTLHPTLCGDIQIPTEKCSSVLN